MTRLRTVSVALMLSLAIAAGATWWLRAPDKRLTNRARNVAALSVIKPGGLDVYTWINRRELLCFREGAAAIDGSFGNGLIVRDVRSGAERHLSRLERLFFYGVGHGISGYDVSTDGRWLLWKAEEQVRATLLDGSRDLRWPEPWGNSGEIRWLADSSGWAAFFLMTQPKQCVINRLEDTAPSKPFKFKALSSAVSSETPTVLPSREVLTNDPSPGVSPVSVVRLQLDGNQSLAQVHPVRPPRGTLRGYLCFSYDGRRMAWVLTMNRRSSFPSWLRRLLPFVRTGDGLFQSLWVSGLDYRNLRELCYIEMKPGDEALRNVRWLPDNRTLSFEHAGALWTIGAD